jgi:hypothetical protein
MNNYFFIFICLTAGLTACRSNGAPEKLEDCPYGKPVAVFGAQIPGISGHQFSSTPYDATEQFMLDDTISVILLQSGCEKPVQEFRFTYALDLEASNSVYPSENAVRFLRRLGSIDPSTLPLIAWAQAIEALPTDWIQGEPRAVQPGTLVKLDWISTAQSQTLILVLGAS